MKQAPEHGDTLLREGRNRALAWQREFGGRIVAVIGPDVPTELIHAAGHYPMRIDFSLRTDGQVGGRYFEPGDSETVAGLVELVVGGGLDFADHLVIGNAPIFNVVLFNFLREARRNAAPPGGPQATLFELHRGGGQAAVQANLANCGRLYDQMVRLGMPDSAPGLDQAVSWSNSRRTALSRLAELRVAHPPQVSGQAALDAMFRAGVFPMDPIAEPASQPCTGPRILFSGSAQNLGDRYRIVESAGCTIVADDHDWGDHIHAPVIATDEDPLAAIAAAAEAQPPRSVRWPAGIRILPPQSKR